MSECRTRAQGHRGAGTAVGSAARSRALGAPTWETEVTISECDSAGLCGEYSYRTEDLYITEQPAACGGTLVYVGVRDTGGTGQDHSFVFQETDPWGEGAVEKFGDPADVCGTAEVILTPMPEGHSLRFQEYRESDGYIDDGLLRCTTC